MAPRRRSARNKDFPDNLYATSTGFEYRHPVTKKRHGMGSDRAKAIQAARILNARLGATVDLVAKIMDEQTIASIIKKFRIEYLPEKNYAERTLSECEYRLLRIERELGANAWASFDLRALSDWLRPLTREAFIKYRNQWIDIYKYACSIGLSERNLAEMTLAKAPGARLRKRWTLEQFKAAREMAAPWLQIAMDMAVLTLQRREDLCAMRFEHIDGDRLLVKQHKTGKRLAIHIGEQLREVIEAAKTRDFLCPYILARIPENARQGSKSHLFQVLPNFLTQSVAEARDATDKFEKYQDGEKPTLHELRSLGAHLYREAGYSEEYIQALLGHTDAAMTQHYLDGHKEKWDEVSADLRLDIR